MQPKTLIASVALGTALTAIPAVPSHALEENIPNLYELRGFNISVVYSTSSFDGSPRLNYQDRQQTLNFAGDEIRTVETEIGTLVTVTTSKSTDRGSTTFTLLIPRIHLGQDNQATIATKGITTVNRFTTIPTFQQEQTQTYTVTPLFGTAQAVAF